MARDIQMNRDSRGFLLTTAVCQGYNVTQVSVNEFQASADYVLPEQAGTCQLVETCDDLNSALEFETKWTNVKFIYYRPSLKNDQKQIRGQPPSRGLPDSIETQSENLNVGNTANKIVTSTSFTGICKTDFPTYNALSIVLWIFIFCSGFLFAIEVVMLLVNGCLYCYDNSESCQACCNACDACDCCRGQHYNDGNDNSADDIHDSNNRENSQKRLTRDTTENSETSNTENSDNYRSLV